MFDTLSFNVCHALFHNRKYFTKANQLAIVKMYTNYGSKLHISESQCTYEEKVHDPIVFKILYDYINLAITVIPLSVTRW